MTPYIPPDRRPIEPVASRAPPLFFSLRTWSAIIIVGLMAIIAFLPGDCRAADPQPKVIKLTIDPQSQWRDYEKAKILQAVNEWNAALEGVVRFEMTPEGGRLIYISLTTRLINSTSYVAGENFPNRIAYYVNAVPAGALTAIMRHELGHALGLGHVPGGVMDQTCCATMQSIDPLSVAYARALHLPARTTP